MCFVYLTTMKNCHLRVHATIQSITTKLYYFYKKTASSFKEKLYFPCEDFDKFDNAMK